MKPFVGHIELAHDPEFGPVIESLLSQYHPESIVETGTHKGTGSTLRLAQFGLPLNTIECNPEYYREAKDNLSYYKNVTCNLGYSIPLAAMQDFIQKDTFYKDSADLDIQVDNPSDPQKFYLQELGEHREFEENLLYKFAGNDTKQLILLDSAGGVGFLEFHYLMDFLKRNNWLDKKILVLDDITHVKHYRSVIELKNRGQKFNSASSGRWGWCVLSNER